MQKKKFDLTSEIVDLNLEKEQLSNNHDHSNVSRKNVLLTISVSEELRREFKTWCVRKNLKMNEAFIKGFESLKKQDYS